MLFMLECYFCWIIECFVAMLIYSSERASEKQKRKIKRRRQIYT